MIRGVESLKTIQQIALRTRQNFEHGEVSDNEIISAALAFGAISLIAKDRFHLKSTEGLIRVDAPYGPYHVSRPLINLDPSSEKPFPKGHCVIATVVLANRIENDDEGKVELIHGGCGENLDAPDQSTYYGNPHTFAGIGRTELGLDTIVDITGDQFPEVSSSVYVGPLRSPWSRDLRSEFDIY
jgi:hypothetical protein